MATDRWEVLIIKDRWHSVFLCSVVEWEVSEAAQLVWQLLEMRSGKVGVSEWCCLLLMLSRNSWQLWSLISWLSSSNYTYAQSVPSISLFAAVLSPFPSLISIYPVPHLFLYPPVSFPPPFSSSEGRVRIGGRLMDELPSLRPLLEEMQPLYKTLFVTRLRSQLPQRQ